MRSITLKYILSMENEKKDFFISYTKQDEQWALWIAGTLEIAGYSTIVQAWDFRPGENFVISMDDALKNSEIFIAVMSEAYLNSTYCKAEWTAAFTNNPSMEKRSFIPVLIEKIKNDGLLKPVVYIDLADKMKKKRRKN